MSVLLLWPSSSPARLRHAGDAALGGMSAEADTAHSELAQVRSRPAADAAAVVKAHLELRMGQVSLPALECRFLRQLFLFTSYGMAFRAASAGCAPHRRRGRWSRSTLPARAACRSCRSRSRGRRPARA